MGCIGLGGRGTVNMQTFLGLKDVQIVGLCDVDAGSNRYEDQWVRGLAPAMQTVQNKYGSPVSGYSDFRDLLARNDIDAVSIGTPDHWHAYITIAAAAAGKDVYCEKPISVTIAEGRAMSDAIARYNRVFQCGSQRRSNPRCRQSCELVRNGRIGKLQTVRVGLMGGYWLRKGRHETNEPEAIPEGFDYDMWLGPAPYAPYTYNRCHWNFRWNLDYAGGMVTDWGAHYLDMAHWGMGTEYTGPVEVEGTGVFPPDTDLYNTAKEFEFTCTYANGVKLIVKSGGGGVKFEGSDGWVNLERNTEPADLRDSGLAPGDVRLYVSENHHQNFIDCVKSRQPTAAPVEVAHRSITPAHLGNIAMRLGRKIRWNPVTETIENDGEANRLVSRPYRAPWTL